MAFFFSHSKFAGVCALNRIFPRKTRKFLAHTAAVGASIAILGIVFVPARDAVILVRAVFLLITLRLILLALESYVRSETYDTAGIADDPDPARRLNYYAATLLGAAGAGQRYASCTLLRLASAVPETIPGTAVLARLGIARDAYQKALASLPDRQAHTTDASDAIVILGAYADRHKDEITTADIMAILFQNLEPLRKFFVEQGLTAEDIRATPAWVERALNHEDRRMRWWTRESLGARRGIGKRWAYGRTFYLNRFAQEWTGSEGADDGLQARKKELALLEASLLKQSGANALLIGEPGSGKKEILAALAARIGRGEVFPALENKRVMMLAGAALTGGAKTKGECEALLLTILNEANRAGNIILAIDDFPEFVASLAALGVNAGQVFAPFLTSSSLHLVALADSIPYRRVLAGDANMLSFFEIIHLGDLDRDRVIEIMEDEVSAYEDARHGKGKNADVIMTYPAIRQAADAALNNLADAVLPKSAMDLMEAAAGSAAAAGEIFVTPAHVSRIVEQKTNLPSGAIGADERTKLNSLEASLHARVIGQDEAVRAIADTIRRARTAVRNPSRPIGSFLFLGPTGVGKTESAKALAAIYFGSEDSMMRFDCTEYQTEDDIAKLLGRAERNDPGILASRVRKTPYGVILLDEFEKSHQQVRNIFLQILDEGFFSDYLGERVNMRNTIIIATSNAGALLIQDIIKQGKSLEDSKELFIEHIEKEAHMAPELLNRFDSLIIFRPLDAPATAAIAKLMLKKLAVRLARQNYMLEITPELIAAVAKGGFDPKFGARPMQRWIQDHVEKDVTDRILSGAITPGTRFTVNTVNNLPLPK